MINDDRWEKWWATQPEDHRERLKRAAEMDTMDTRTGQFVLKANPPLGLTGGKWEHELDFSWSLAPSLREFILAQQ